MTDSNDKLIELVKSRIAEFDEKIKRCLRNGSHSSVRHYEKLRQDQELLLLKLENGKTFYLEEKYVH